MRRVIRNLLAPKYKLLTSLMLILLILSFIVTFSSAAIEADNEIDDNRYRGWLNDLAREFYEQGNTDEILLELEELEKELADSSDYETYLRLAELEIFRGEIKEVIGDDIAEDYFANGYELAQKAIELENTAQANRLAAEGLSYLFNYRSTFFIIRNANNAEQYLNKAEELAPENLMVKLLKANFYVNAPGIAGGDKDKGLTLFAEIKEKDRPLFTFAVLNSLAQLHESAGEEEKVEEKRAAAGEIFPESPWIADMPLRKF